ncbi:MAG: FAD/NAD(P)-binding protein [Bryobacterales bacterium]|nr:FAD/NAD(P)-binding protein [Bryobacteraceae bacterium]MDW8130553.1 FAD/NAD(P)-binding protein [Bryobacterales bacterium]
MSATAERILTTTRARVIAVERETHDTFTLTVAPADGAAFEPFQPGQFSMLYVFGVGELPISISGDPAEAERLVYTVRSVGQATHALVSRKPGELIGVRGPFGTSWPVKEARGKDVLIVAGGIGLAPLRPVVYHVLRNRDDYVRLILLYGARSPRDLLYRKQLAEWGRAPDTQVLVTVDYGGLSWRGHVGVVTTLFRQLRLHPAETAAFICGPEIMMRYVIRMLEARGLAPQDIHLSMERNMKCGAGFCGHCQMGPYFVCKDGPVFSYRQMQPWLDVHEL